MASPGLVPLQPSGQAAAAIAAPALCRQLHIRRRGRSRTAGPKVNHQRRTRVRMPGRERLSRAQCSRSIPSPPPLLPSQRARGVRRGVRRWTQCVRCACSTGMQVPTQHHSPAWPEGASLATRLDAIHLALRQPACCRSQFLLLLLFLGLGRGGGCL